MLGVIKLMFETVIARLFGWYLCVLEGTERQKRLLLKLSDPERGEPMDLADCFLREDRQDVTATFVSLDRLREIPGALRMALEILFWVKPAPQYLILKHALTGKEEYFNKNHYTHEVEER